MADQVVNKEELSKLFETFDNADKEWEARKAAVETSYKERSNAVEAIAKLIAPQKKIRRAGKELTIVVRGTSWFFKGAGKKDNEILDI